ncbi:MAG: sn-glycerol-3-phosphate ABC transporter ATP-binding protein UgpC [Enterobacteriaceae bacterium]|nr:sn-glycerol-3-phosphate ABC transporter ATP-binding protein UgpC [Enterobacteriaceae bacterium]
MASVTIDNVKKSYGVHHVLHDISVDIADGEFTVLVGPSGCGKSTLLRMVAGLESITAGDIAIGGRVVNDLPPKQRDISMVFQNYALYPHMTVAENMAFSMTLSGAKKAEKEQKVNEAAEILGLTPLLKRYPRQLSGGQRQRVAMGRSLVRNPQVFLFDEPLSNLDARLRVAMRAELKSLHQRLKTTILYVTHDQVEAMTMADKIVVLQNGRIEQTGTPLELYDFPANTFVATFIGSPSMNLLHGEIGERGSERIFISRSRQRLPLPDHYQHLAVGTPVTFGIRPEHFQYSARPTDFEATVELVEPMGSETQVQLSLGGEKAIAVFRERIQQRTGDRLWFTPQVEKVSLFEHESGRLISRREEAERR